MSDGIAAVASVLIQLFPFIVLLLLGLVVGRRREVAHLQDLQQREGMHADMLLVASGRFPGMVSAGVSPVLLVAEVVIASDYLKSFLAGLRNVFGGEVGSYRLLLERARREAILRVLEEAREKGCDAVCNLRLETADIGGASGRRKNAMCAVIASGTGYRRQSR